MQNLTLSELIEYLKALPQGMVVPQGFNNPHSYRGYYEQLAFEPAGPMTVKEILTTARSAMRRTFQGYKGGDYKMGKDTEVWLAHYGSSGIQISDFLLSLMMKPEKPEEVQLRKLAESYRAALTHVGISIPSDKECLSDWEASIHEFRAGVVKESKLLEKVEELSKLTPVLVAARALRAAQQGYMAKRGDQDLGRLVALAAADLDQAIRAIDPKWKV